MTTGQLELLGLGLFCLIEIIFYYHLVIKPKLLLYMQNNYINKELYAAQVAEIKEDLTEIKADVKMLIQAQEHTIGGHNGQRV